MRRGWSLLESWDGIVRLKGRYAGRRFSVREAVVLERPARVYLEALLPLGRSGPVVAASEGTVRVLWASDRVYLDAPASGETMRRLVGVAATPPELTAVLTGFGVPWDVYERVGAAEPGEDGSLRFDLESRTLGRKAEVVLTAGIAAVQRGSVRDMQGQLVYAFQYEQLESFGSYAFPGRIRLQAQELSLELRPQGVNRNVGRREPALFRPRPPPNSRKLAPEALEEALLLMPEAGS